jgi:hypothetical protein
MSNPKNSYRNNLLFNRLTRLYGDVRVAHEGEEGEEYRICCPFCHDKFHRLYVNCKWGVIDPLTQQSNIHLVNCYNEKCVDPLKDDERTWQKRCENRQELFDTVYRGLGRQISLSPISATQKPENEPAEWPGRVIRLNTLASKYPTHPAVTYLQARGFDPAQLGTQYGFVYCDQVTNPLYQMAENTIIIPIWKGNMLYSWISRKIGEAPPNTPRKKWKKYYNMPGRSMSTVGYNLDLALCYSTLVIVEGVFDAIKTGAYATCMFTNSVPATLRKQIVKGLAVYGDDAVVVIMLDPSQSDEANRRKSVHHIEAAAAAFVNYVPHVLKIYLPNNQDPGSMTHEEITKVILQTAEQENVKINLNQITKYDFKTIARRVAELANARTGLTTYGTPRLQHTARQFTDTNNPASRVPSYADFDGRSE